MLNLSAGDTQNAQAQLAEAHRELSNLLREMPAVASPQLERDGVIGALKRSVEQEFAPAFDSVTWQVEPDAETRAMSLPALHGEVLYAAAREAIRNAAKHGRGDGKTRHLNLWVSAGWNEGLSLEIQDDGVGMGHNPNGGGQGLNLHSTMMAVMAGELRMERVGARTSVRLFLPKTCWL
jgi:signal transduction histidine kinase